MTRWSRSSSPGRQFRAQAYFDHVYRRVARQFRDVRNTFDVDLQQHIVAGRHDVVFGGGFRASRGDDTGNAAFHFDPQARPGQAAEPADAGGYRERDGFLE